MNTTPETNILSMFDDINKDAYIISISVFTAIAGIMNLFLIVVILLSSILRCSSKHLIILAICICNLYDASFVHPLFIQLMREEWNYGCELFIALNYNSYYIMLSILSLLLISLGVDFVVRLFTRRKLMPIILAIAMVITAVVASVAVILPLALTGELVIDHSYWSIAGCYLKFNKDYLLALEVTSIFPQAFLMLVVMGLVSCFSCISSNTAVAKPYPLDIVLASVVMIVLELPILIYFQMDTSCSSDETCMQILTAVAMIKLLPYLRPFLMSCVWFLCPTTRKGIRQIFCCCPEPVGDSERSDHAVRYEMNNMPGIDNEAIGM